MIQPHCTWNQPKECPSLSKKAMKSNDGHSTTAGSSIVSDRPKASGSYAKLKAPVSRPKAWGLTRRILTGLAVAGVGALACSHSTDLLGLTADTAAFVTEGASQISDLVKTQGREYARWASDTLAKAETDFSASDYGQRALAGWQRCQSLAEPVTSVATSYGNRLISRMPTSFNDVALHLKGLPDVARAAVSSLAVKEIQKRILTRASKAMKSRVPGIGTKTLTATPPADDLLQPIERSKPSESSTTDSVLASTYDAKGSNTTRYATKTGGRLQCSKGCR